MADSTNTPEGFSLKRWSRRKLEAAREVPAAVPAAIEAVPPPAAATPATAAETPPVAADAPVLPPVESLTHDSDFSAFMQPKVDEAVKRAALKKLFTDPRFNVMDGLDIYVGDYTQPDPMPEGMLEKLGKVYAAVTHDDDADAQRPASVSVAEAASAEPTPLQAIPADTGQEVIVADGVDAAAALAADAPAPEAASGTPVAAQVSTTLNPPLAQPRGKSQ